MVPKSMAVNNSNTKIDLSMAVGRALQIRKLYNQLEEHLHGTSWTNQEDLIGLSSDIGELGRLVMATEGRWSHEGNLNKELGDKLSECLWWILVLSERLGINLTMAFISKMDVLDDSLTSSITKLKRPS